jgi:hypothetical protein
MPRSQTEQLLAYVDDLLKATSEGKIDWREANPTTYFWENPGPNSARLTLQQITVTVKISGPPSATSNAEERTFYVLTVNGLTSGSPDVTLKGQALDAQINEKLGLIYKLIGADLERREIEFLRSTLPK